MAESSGERLRANYEANKDELFAYAYAITRSRELAEDAIHNAFGRLLKRTSLPRDLRPYVFRAVRNAAIDELRVRGRECASEPALLIDESRRNGHDPALQVQLVDLMTQLSDDERESIVLKIYSGMTFNEIGALRGVPLHTAASWYRRGIEKLRILMEDPNDG